MSRPPAWFNDKAQAILDRVYARYLSGDPIDYANLKLEFEADSNDEFRKMCGDRWLENLPGWLERDGKPSGLVPSWRCIPLLNDRELLKDIRSLTIQIRGLSRAGIEAKEKVTITPSRLSELSRIPLDRVWKAIQLCFGQVGGWKHGAGRGKEAPEPYFVIHLIDSDWDPLSEKTYVAEAGYVSGDPAPIPPGGDNREAGINESSPIRQPLWQSDHADEERDPGSETHDDLPQPSQDTPPGFQTPWFFLRASIKAVPESKYSLVVVGLGAAGGIVAGLAKGSLVLGFGGVGLALAFSFFAYLFVRAVRLDTKHAKWPTLVFLWVMTLVGCGAAIFTLTSVFLGWPQDWQPGPVSSVSKGEKAHVVTLPSGGKAVIVHQLNFALKLDADKNYDQETESVLVWFFYPKLASSLITEDNQLDEVVNSTASYWVSTEKSRTVSLGEIGRFKVFARNVALNQGSVRSADLEIMPLR